MTVKYMATDGKLFDTPEECLKYERNMETQDGLLGLLTVIAIAVVIVILV